MLNANIVIIGKDSRFKKKDRANEMRTVRQVAVKVGSLPSLYCLVFFKIIIATIPIIR